jgi:hypothetical protein
MQTITQVDVGFSLDAKSVIPSFILERLPVAPNIPPEVRGIPQFVQPADSGLFPDALTHWDTGIIAQTDPVGVRMLSDPRVIVRWTDRWGTRWEHKSGHVHPVDESAQWVP